MPTALLDLLNKNKHELQRQFILDKGCIIYPDYWLHTTKKYLLYLDT